MIYILQFHMWVNHEVILRKCLVGILVSNDSRRGWFKPEIICILLHLPMIPMIKVVQYMLDLLMLYTVIIIRMLLYKGVLHS